MNSSELAAKLVSAQTSRHLNRLIAEHRSLFSIEFAEHLNDICLLNWRSQPTLARNAAKALKAIAEVVPETEVKALAAWAQGIGEITKGKLEAAVRQLEEASLLFRRIGKKHESAQPQVALLMALAMLNQYDRAEAVGRRALRIFEENGNELAAGKIEINLHNIACGQRRYRRAEKLGLSAYGRFAKIDEPGWRAMAGNDLAITYSQLNDFRSAEIYFRAALEIARSAGMTLTEAEIEASMGNLALYRGKYADALNFLELSRQKYEELRMPHQTAIAELEIADIYSELNMTGEALNLYARCIKTLAKLKLRAEEARARSNAGKAAIRLRKTMFSRNQFDRALELYEGIGDRNGIASVMLNRAYLELKLTNYGAAHKFGLKASEIFGRNKNERQAISAKWLIGEVLSRSGNRVAALKSLKSTLNKSLELDQNQIALLALNSLGKTSNGLGNSSEAKHYFKRAIALTEHTREPLPGEEFRMAFLDGKLEPYQNLAWTYILEKKLADAFRFVEKGRSKSLFESVAGFGAKSHVPAGLAEKGELLREQLNHYYSAANTGRGYPSGELQAKIGKTERELSTVLRRAESTGKKHKATLKDPGHDVKIEILQTQIGPEQALIEYVNFNGVLSAFVITDKSVNFFSELSAESEILSELEQLRFQFGALRYGRAAVGPFASQLTERANKHLCKLYDKLIRPLEFAIADRDLIVIATGSLHYVPFNALHDSSRYIIESRLVTNSPSASIWQILKAKPELRLNRPLLMGYADENAPETENEVRAIKEILPSSQIYIGSHATFLNFREKAPMHDILHLACHGQFRSDNPLFSSLNLADGRITVRDVADLRLSAGLVTLSACETGLNRLFAGDEIIGLARGFLSAGVRSILVSLWTVSDEATKGLMKSFYSNLQRGTSVSTSLSNAQQEFIQQGEHPYYWAPFILIS